eukprot:TRINITY_DN2163_c0_g1_i1.p1 TRINITY_DN2163_c0_g1~~TRINITY_DN2163_c0_g1_i1.p1  ORF type:complete len:544 (+),score=96.98 TRINITY_DN2163_c0_g1_i1:90-1634(+)
MGPHAKAADVHPAGSPEGAGSSWSGLREAGSSDALPPTLLTESDSVDAVGSALTDGPVDLIELSRQWNQGCMQAMQDGTVGALIGGFATEDFEYEVSEDYTSGPLMAPGGRMYAKGYQQVIEMYNWSITALYNDGLGIRVLWTSFQQVGSLTVRCRTWVEVVAPSGDLNRIELDVCDITYSRDSNPRATYLHEKVAVFPADLVVVPRGVGCDRICVYVRMLFDCLTVSSSDGSFADFVEAAFAPDLVMESTCPWREPQTQVLSGREDLWAFHNHKLQEMQRLIPGELTWASTWGDMCVVAENTVRMERRHKLAVSGNYMLHGVVIQRGEVSEVTLKRGRISGVRTYDFETPDLGPAPGVPDWVHPPAWRELQGPAPAGGAAEAPPAQGDQFPHPPLQPIVTTVALANPALHLPADGEAVPPAAEASAGEPQCAVPCVHNSWDSLRIRKGHAALRCRECGAQWRVEAAWLASSRCKGFDAGSCTAADCAALHVHRIKLKGQPASSPTPDPPPPAT